MNKISKIAIENSEKFVLKNKQWGFEDYNNTVYAQIAYDEDGFNVKFTVFESNPLCEKQNNFEAVCQDSCVEFFVNFSPATSNKYFNIEINAKGVTNSSFRTSRYDPTHLSDEDIKSLNIKTEIFDDYWTASYKIGFSLIKKYYPAFDFSQTDYILANIYKCGENTIPEHYLTYFEIKVDTPDYHRPEFFGKFTIEK